MMPFPRRSGPAIAPAISLVDALFHLREIVDEAEVASLPALQIAKVNKLIAAATRQCEDRIERCLVQTPWHLTLDAFPGAIVLRQPPIIAVQQVSYTAPDGSAVLLDPQDYALDKASGPGYLVPAHGKRWPATSQGINTITVSYTAGYGPSAATVPEPLHQWMLLAITDMYDTAGASAERAMVAHSFVDHLLNPYRVEGV